MPEILSNISLNNESKVENALDSTNGKDYVTQDQLPTGLTTSISYDEVYTCEDNSTGNGRLSWGNGSTDANTGAVIMKSGGIITKVGISTGSTASNQNINIEINNVVVASITHSGTSVVYPQNIVVSEGDFINLNRTSNSGGGIITGSISVTYDIDVTSLQGPQGPQGPTGDDGLDGNSIITGGSVPPSNPAPLQAAYFQTNGDVYISENTNTWNFLYNIMPFSILTSKFTNIAVTNINTNALFNGINTTPVFDQVGSNISVTSNRITFLASGTYEVYFNLYQTGNSTRTNVGIEFSLNGTGTGRISASAYIRNGSGHNESSTNLKETFEIATNDFIEINTLALGGGGTVSAPVGASLLEVRKLS